MTNTQKYNVRPKKALRGLLLIFACLLPSIRTVAERSLVDSLASVLENVNEKGSHLPAEQKVAVLFEMAEEVRLNSPDSALYYYHLALEWADASNLTLQKGNILNKSGYANYMLGNFEKALPLFVEALEIHNQLGNDIGISTSLNYIGLIYEAQENHPDALKYQWKSLAYSEKAKDADRLMSNYYNLSMIHDEMAELDSSLFYAEKAISLSKRENSQRRLAQSYNRAGIVYLHLNRLDDSKKAFESSLAIQSADNYWEACFSYAGLAQVHQLRGENKEAIGVARQSLELAKELRSKWDIVEASRILYECYKAENDFSRALAMLEVSKQYSDSLFNETKVKEINHLHLMRNESERDRLEKENALQKSAIEQSNLWVGFFVVVGILLAIWGIAQYRNNSQRSVLNEQLRKNNESIAERNAKIEEQNRELNELNETKNQLLSIIGHDMRSPINNIKIILKIIKEGRLSAQDQEKVFDDLYKTVSSVAETMNNMLTWASSQLKGIQITPVRISVAQVVEDSMRIFVPPAESKEIELYHEEDDRVMVYADTNHLQTILRNLISNAVKFTKRHGRVSIKYRYVDEHNVAIEVADTGVGMSSEKIKQLFKFKGRSQSVGTSNELGTGIGLMLTKEFVESNQGKIEVTSEDGFGSRFTIILPAAVLELAEPEPA